MIHVQNEKEPQYPVHHLCLFPVNSQHVHEVLHKSEFGVPGTNLLWMASSKEEYPSH